MFNIKKKKKTLSLLIGTQDYNISNSQELS